MTIIYPAWLCCSAAWWRLLFRSSSRSLTTTKSRRDGTTLRPYNHATMLSALFSFALLQVASALSISLPHNNEARSTTHHIQARGLTVNEKVAIGICIPGAGLVVILALIVFCMYPAQTRKLRRENPGVKIGFAEVMAGRVEQPGGEPPKYSARSSTNGARGPGENIELPAFQGALHGR